MSTEEEQPVLGAAAANTLQFANHTVSGVKSGVSAMSSTHAAMNEMTGVPAVDSAERAKTRRRLLCIAIAAGLGFCGATLPLGFKAVDAPAQRMLGVLVVVSTLWATEALPTYVTALLVPVFVVTFKTMKMPDGKKGGADILVPNKFCRAAELAKVIPGAVMEPAAAASTVVAAMFDPIVLLFLAGFTMAAALDKYKLNQRLVATLLARAGTRPSRILLSVMLLCVFLSMWVSNVAAAVLNVSFMVPLLRTLPRDSGWPKMSLLGIAYACNIGGMATPIASPQNVLAIVAIESASGGKISISFLEWCAFSVPFCSLCTLVCWGFLRAMYKTRLPAGITYSFEGGAKEASKGGGGGAMVLRTQTQQTQLAAGEMLRDAVRSVDAAGGLLGESVEPEAKARLVSLASELQQLLDDACTIDAPSGADEGDGESGLAIVRGESVNGEATDGDRSAAMRRRSSSRLPLTAESSASSSPPPRSKEGAAQDATAAAAAAAAADGMGLGRDEVVILVVIGATVVMWCIPQLVKETFGHIGVISLLPFSIFFGCGYLSQAEFESLPWSVLMLMGGGLALGAAIESSGLLGIIATGVLSALKGQSIGVVFLVSNLMIGVVGNFVSSTVSAIILLPIVAQVGIDYKHPIMLVVGGAIMCSGSMGLPVSSFPNANSFTARRSGGEPFLQTADYVQTGFPMALMVLLLLQTVGMGLCSLLGW